MRRRELHIFILSPVFTHSYVAIMPSVLGVTCGSRDRGLLEFTFALDRGSVTLECGTMVRQCKPKRGFSSQLRLNHALVLADKIVRHTGPWSTPKLCAAITISTDLWLRKCVPNSLKRALRSVGL